MRFVPGLETLEDRNVPAAGGGKGIGHLVSAHAHELQAARVADGPQGIGQMMKVFTNEHNWGHVKKLPPAPTPDPVPVV